MGNLVQLTLTLLLHAFCLHDLAHGFDAEHLLQLACFTEITFRVSGALHGTQELGLRHLREKTLLHLDVLGKVLHILRKRDVERALRRHDCRGLPSHPPRPLTHGRTHAAMVEIAQSRADAALVKQMVLNVLLLLQLLLLQPELLLSLQLLKLELLL